MTGAVALAVALATLVATDAGASAGLAWAGGGVAVSLLVAAHLTRSSGAAHWALGVLGAMLLLRADLRLMLAPVYGGTLVLIEALAVASIELRAVAWTGEVLSARLAAALAVAASGACAAAAVAVAVTVAPGRSIALTAAGAVAALALFAWIVGLARRREAAMSTTAPVERSDVNANHGTGESTGDQPPHNQHGKV